MYFLPIPRGAFSDSILRYCNAPRNNSKCGQSYKQSHDVIEESGIFVVETTGFSAGRMFAKEEIDYKCGQSWWTR
jgi:hypothetical protein